MLALSIFFQVTIDNLGDVFLMYFCSFQLIFCWFCFP